jgi:hypothetical protein
VYDAGGRICLVCATGHSPAMVRPPSVVPGVQAGSGSHASGSVMLTCRAWQLPAGIAATAATMLASFCAKDAAVLAGTCVTVDDGVLVLGEPHPASATPTTAMMVARAPRRITFRPPSWVGWRSDRHATYHQLALVPAALPRLSWVRAFPGSGTACRGAVQAADDSRPAPRQACRRDELLLPPASLGLRPTSSVRLTWTGWRRRDQYLPCLGRPTSSRQDTTGHNENKPVGQSKLAAQPPQAHLPGQEKSGISRPSRPPVSPQGAAVCVPLLRPHVRRPRRPFHEHSSPLHT